MKMILRIITAPITLFLDLVTWIFLGLIFCSSLLFQLASGIISVLAVAVLITYSVKSGLILLFIAFLVSPIGLPMISIWFLGRVQDISLFLKKTLR